MAVNKPSNIYEEINDYARYLFERAQEDGADTDWCDVSILELLEQKNYHHALDEVEHATDPRYEPLRAFLRGIVMGKEI